MRFTIVSRYPGTEPVPDTTAPSVPTGLSATAVSSSQINLAWSASTDNVGGSGVAGYRIYRNGGFLTQVSGTGYSDTPLAAATLYTYRVSSYDNAQNESAQSAQAQATTFASNLGPSWSATPAPSFTNGTASSYSLVPSFVSDPEGDTITLTLLSGTLPSGVTLNNSTKALDYNGTGAVATANGIVIRATATGGTADSSAFAVSIASSTVNPLLEADWQARINSAGVVFYHDFRSPNEVNAFRWCQGLGSGNDPTDSPSGSRPVDTCEQITTDGITGGCLELTRLAGANDSKDLWRPLAPIQGGTTSGNGRGVGQNDPGAAGRLTLRAYAPTSGGSQISGWTGNVYGTFGAGPYDHGDYWIQCRVKLDPRRQQGINQSIDSGKLFYFTRTDKSLTSQEIVTFAGTKGTAQSGFEMYRSGSPNLSQDPPGEGVQGNQPGSEFAGGALCKLTSGAGGSQANCWFWNNGFWDTILYHVRCGSSQGLGDTFPGNNDTLIEVWAAHDGETEYTKIWNQPNANLPFDVFYGHNALIISIYHNSNTMTPFNQRYCQLIFSWDPIPCPQINTNGTGSALAIAAYNEIAA